MSHDLRARARERALLRNPEDPAAWLGLARERERGGGRAGALLAAVEALRRAPQDPEVLRALEELGWSGPWSAEDGDASGASRSPLPGPGEGVVAWRAELPQQLLGRPRVDPLGRVVVRGVTSGLYRLDHDGRTVEPLGEWPTSVPPVLLGEAPGALDPSSHLFRSPGWEPGRVGLTVRDPAGEAWVAGRHALLALDPDGLPRWRAPVSGPAARLAVGPVGPLWALFTPSGEEGTLFAFARDTGAALGAHVLPHPASLVVSADGSAWVGCAGALVEVDPQGRMRRRLPLEGVARLALSPGAQGAGGDGGSAGQLLAVTRGQGLVAFDLDSGEARWRRPALRSTLTPAVDAEGAAVLVTVEGRVVGLAPDGQVRFELAVDRRGPLGAPALGGGRAYLTAGRWLLAIR